MRTRKIVLLDIDKTLIDPSYQFTADISSEIEAVQKSGIEIGICSDTPLLSIKELAEKIGLTGPMIAELGAVIFYPRERDLVKLHPFTEVFPKARDEFVNELLSLFPEITVCVGDNVKFVREDTLLGSPGESTVFISGCREHSIAFHVKTIRSHSLENEPKLQGIVTKVAEETLVRCTGEEKEKFSIDQNLEYGVTIIHYSGTNKRNAVESMIEKMNTSFIAMVGDSRSDFLNDKRILQFGVHNADVEKYGQFCEYVSPFEYTEGVKDILRLIRSDNKYREIWP